MLTYNENNKLTVINLFGGPGTGKSTTAAGLFHIMKRCGYNVELVTEYAKDCVWSERMNMFTEQDYLFAEQNHRLRRLVGKVEYAITDSPILLGLFYLPQDFPPSFRKFVIESFETYTNHNFLIKRMGNYVQLGRNETAEQSDAISQNIEHHLNSLNYQYITVDGNNTAPEQIYDSIFGSLPL